MDTYFKLNTGLLVDLDIYFGEKLKLMKLHNGVWCLDLSPECYVRELLKNVEKYFTDYLGPRWKFLTRADNPFSIRYAPEIYNYS